ncbi:glycosyl transferase family 39 [Longimycelium tulufanense]|uniref:Glycosyl transferase family 39 n=1 Tax=Longimycelium tulufanense TaxID=907463 RepID=A0A8J3CB22_9PSEU|nr:glycosyltransferase family 39 protein [Longimycelium tulufanense]GGM42719.1 glycosyl transferase family 39 [Longimycelium tulufanense]
MTQIAMSPEHGRPKHAQSDIPFAWKPVAPVAAAVGLVLALTITRYGYDGDEIYFVAAGHHLDWGYVDQPPLLPLLAGMLDALAPGNLVVLRIPAILLTVAGVFLTAAIAREFGAQARAQVIAAATYAVSPFMLYFGHSFTTTTVNVFLTALVTWLLVRWTRLRHDVLLLWAGLATAVALLAKYLIVSFWAIAITSVLVVGPRDLLRRPRLWVGGAVALLAAAPSLIWQADHGWPQFSMTKAIALEQQTYFYGRLGFVPMVLVNAGLLVGAVLFCYGLWRLLRAPRLRPYRFLGWTFVGLLVVFLWTNGRASYLMGVLPVLWAVAAAEIQVRKPAMWWRWAPTWPVYALTGVLSVVGALPVLPVSTAAQTGSLALLQDGWPSLVETVSKAYHTLPVSATDKIVLVGETYQYAAVLDQLGPRHGLPPVYGGHRGYWYFGRPSDDTNAVMVVGGDGSALRKHFAQVQLLAQYNDGKPSPNPALGAPRVWLCTGPLQPWPQLWEDFYHLNLPPELLHRTPAERRS